MLIEQIKKIESSQLNLADSIVNGFVNIGTSKDSLFKDKNDWLLKV